MKKLLLIFSTVLLGLMASCTPYDDSAILDKIAELEKEIEQLTGNSNTGGNGGGATEVDLNKIYYTTTDGKKLFPYSTDPNMFGAVLVSNTYADGQGVLVFDDTITSIGQSAFRNCSNLENITIPDGVTSIGESAFDGCSSLESLYITDIVAWCKITFDNSSSNPLYYAKNLYLNGELVTDLTIPDSVTSIGSDAFRECSSLASVTIGNGVTSIGDDAFWGCKSLASITIGNGVTSIGSDAFYYCSSLASVTIPDSVTSIGYDAFYKCSSLSSVTIGNGVTSIGDDAFEGCSSLAEVYCKPTTPPMGGYDIFSDNASGRKIYVPTESVEAYKSAKYWNEYASDIVGYNF